MEMHERIEQKVRTCENANGASLPFEIPATPLDSALWILADALRNPASCQGPKEGLLRMTLKDVRHINVVLFYGRTKCVCNLLKREYEAFCRK